MGTNGKEVSSLITELRELPPDEVIFGCSRVMKEIRRKVMRIAGANVPVLIQGESGTGKELIAALLHRHSPWENGPFVKVSCPSIPGTLLESELFGYEKGAFTGAYGSKPGRVEMAHRGTLFLDEIGELDQALQAKLLQVLQDGQFCRIGSQEDKKVDARVVCATNRNLKKEMEEGTFRQDLFYRINVLEVYLPPLRDRREDIPYIVNFLLGHYSTKFRCETAPISSRLLGVFQSYHWPGNIRELENVIKRYVIMDSEEAIISEMLAGPKPRLDAAAMIPTDGSVTLKEATRHLVQDLERRMILATLESTRWNRKKAAKKLGISYRALLYKIQQANLPSRVTATLPVDDSPVHDSSSENEEETTYLAENE